MLARVRHSDAVAAALIFALLLSACLLTASASLNTIDFRINYLQTQALADAQTIYLPPHPELLYQGPSGQWVSKYGLGLPILSVPLYVAGEALPRILYPSGQARDLTLHFVMLTNDVVTAVTGALLFLVCRRIPCGRGVSSAVAIAWGVTTPALVYADTLFSEPVVALCLVLATLALLEYERRGENGRFWALALASFSLGYALVTRASSVAMVPLFLLYAAHAAMKHPEGSDLRRLLRRNPARDSGGQGADSGSQFRALLSAVVALALPLGVLGASVLWYNFARHGNPLDFGYVGEAFSSPLLEGVYGLVASPGKGLVEYAPLVLLSAVGWPAFFRARPGVALLCAGITGVALLQGALWWAWWGGWCWGPRFLVPALPFALLPMCTLLGASVTARRSALVLGGLGLAVTLSGALVDVNSYLTAAYSADLVEPQIYLRAELSPILGHVRYVLEGQHIDSVAFRAGASRVPPVRLFPVVALGVLVVSAVLLFGRSGLARNSGSRAPENPSSGQ